MVTHSQHILQLNNNKKTIQTSLNAGVFQIAGCPLNGNTRYYALIPQHDSSKANEDTTLPVTHISSLEVLSPHTRLRLVSVLQILLAVMSSGS